MQCMGSAGPHLSVDKSIPVNLSQVLAVTTDLIQWSVIGHT